MNPGTKDLREKALGIANKRMRREIAPLLSIQHPRINSWNPLRLDDPAYSEYGMKLWTSDKMVQELMRNDMLMEQVDQIVVESVEDAIMDTPEDFIQAALASLIHDD